MKNDSWILKLSTVSLTMVMGLMVGCSDKKSDTPAASSTKDPIQAETINADQLRAENLLDLSEQAKNLREVMVDGVTSNKKISVLTEAFIADAEKSLLQEHEAYVNMAYTAAGENNGTEAFETIQDVLALLSEVNAPNLEVVETTPQVSLAPEAQQFIDEKAHKRQEKINQALAFLF